MKEELTGKQNVPFSLDDNKLPEVIPRPQLRWWGFASASAILLVSGFAIGLLRLPKQKPPAQVTAANILPVKTKKIAAVKSYSVVQTYTGEVASVRTSELGFERSGRVIWLKVDRGERVITGSPIAKLDTSNLEAQRQQLLARKTQAIAVLDELKAGPRKEKIASSLAQLQDLEEQLKLEEIRRERRKKLYTDGAISRERYDEVAFNANALSRRLAAARSNLQELQVGTRKEQIVAQQAVVKQLDAQITDLEITIAKSTIKAPFSGKIAKRHLDEGTVVNGGQSVVRLVENAQPEVEIGVPLQLIAKIIPGSRKKVVIGQKTYLARVKSILPEVNPITRTRTVILNVKTSQPQSLAPGQIARLQLSQDLPTKGYWLPINSLARGEKGLWSSYVLAEPKQQGSPTKAYLVERRDVEILYTESDQVLVRGAIKSGDRVITEGIQRIVTGQLVRPVDDF
ncbi:efflux RND transporter periplasmic adaptor subunit [Calothrix rhizosoleniae]|uniref:efflux RND transporter periplasmic adaptor subunit n=1 Tax=Calothrix rhizosoleniae TaxID=888997 RepID=UPI000B49E7F1|nr:efflux RND transporter periplasmic adaptor subunit [Calothrix rhizosoleniae]